MRLGTAPDICGNHVNAAIVSLLKRNLQAPLLLVHGYHGELDGWVGGKSAFYLSMLRSFARNTSAAFHSQRYPKAFGPRRPQSLTDPGLANRALAGTSATSEISPLTHFYWLVNSRTDAVLEQDCADCARNQEGVTRCLSKLYPGATDLKHEQMRHRARIGDDDNAEASGGDCDYDNRAAGEAGALRCQPSAKKCSVA